MTRWWETYPRRQAHISAHSLPTCKFKIQRNLDFSNAGYFETLDASNQKSFPSLAKHLIFTFDCLNSLICRTKFRFLLKVEKSRFTVLYFDSLYVISKNLVAYPDRIS